MTKEEALKQIREWDFLNDEERAALETLIPELKESEDERIRKWVYAYIMACPNENFEFYGGVGKGRVLAYLEKQKEQNWDKKPCLTCQEYEKGHKQGYTEGCTAGYNKAMKEVDEQKEQNPTDLPAGFYVTLDGKKYYAKEMRCNGMTVKVVEPKPAWSEEDEEMRNLIVAIFEVNHPNGFFKANELGTTDMRGVHTEEIVSWLKSLPLNHKKKNEDVAKLCSNEWSEEDERIIDTIVSVLGQYIDYKAVSGTGTGYATPRYSKEIDWLRSLHPSWKPSKEQMRALKETIDFAPETFKPRCTLMTLQHDLEKLM